MINKQQIKFNIASYRNKFQDKSALFKTHCRVFLSNLSHVIKYYLIINFYKTILISLNKKTYIVPSILMIFTLLQINYDFLSINKYFLPQAAAKTKYIVVKEAIHDDPEESMEQFLNNLSAKESGNNYTAVNGVYLGKYQIGPAAFADIGINVKKEVFLETPDLQEIAVRLYFKKNKEYLRMHIGKYISTSIRGIYITESGVLAMAFLVGSSPTIKWLDSGGKLPDGKNYEPVDGNGTKGTTYLVKYGGYKLNFK